MSKRPPGTPADVPHCMRCRHHQITHDPVFRYACRQLGFKSRQLPCRAVEENSGLPCQYFELRRLTGTG